MLREVEFDIMPEIVERWSPRAFSKEPISQEDIDAVLTAASLAPSAYNEQPWRFLVATSQEDKDFLAEYMIPGNSLWAKDAPVLIVIIGDVYFKKNDMYNYWVGFDTGCAWGYLSLEAKRRGLETHCMGAFDRNDLKKDLKLAERYDIYGIIAMGKYGEFDQLSDVQKKEEKPDPRKKLEQLMIKK